MKNRVLYLNSEKTASVKAYLLDSVDGIPFGEARPAILIFPGGGYTHCSEREAEPIAMHYLAQGYNAFVLNYSCNRRFPAPLIEAAYALYKIRARADEFNIDKDKIAVWGASAGGHLAGCLATMWSDSALVNAVGCEPAELRPNAAVLSYPVISGITSPHKGSFDVILGENPTPSELSRLSLENRVTPKTPPCFIWCTANDDCVSAHNSLVFAKACVSNKVPCELHMFDEGPHGLSDCSKNTGWNESFYKNDNKRWIEMSIKFLEKYLKV
ncbi:MAG: alpha/beta hydrolase [Firmicutes bacterium]|nr:alpha/beta hydrolase [[Eubacterium] siraeum]MCM1487519.1 alpha/beta hydrolase [Bacillota bacterium]